MARRGRNQGGTRDDGRDQHRVSRHGSAIEHKRQQNVVSEIPHEPRDIDEAQAMALDPELMREWNEVLENTKTHSHFGVFALKQLAQSPWIQCIVNTRINQVLNFARMREDKFGLGFEIAMRETKRSPTKQEQIVARKLGEKMLTCGDLDRPIDRFTRKHFDVFLAEIVRDSLVMDSACFETIMDRRDKYVKWWQPVDASKIFRTMPMNVYGEWDEHDAAYVQRWQEQDVAWWAIDQLCFGVRRSRTDIETVGYGWPELAEMLEVITGMMAGWAYNFKYFQNGGPRGAISINGEISKKKLLGFQRQMLFAASGLKNAYRTLIVNPPLNGGIQWVPFGVPNKEMEFSAWIDANYLLACGIFGIDRDETGFHYGAQEARAIYEGNKEAKLKNSRSKGLLPLLAKIEFWINQFIMERLEHGEDFRVKFIDNTTLSEIERAELNQTMVNTTHTVNEVRGMMDMEELDDGDVMLPVYVATAQARVQMLMQQQQAELAAQQGQDGANGAGGDAGGNGDGSGGGGAQDGQDGAEVDPTTDWGPDTSAATDWQTGFEKQGGAQKMLASHLDAEKALERMAAVRAGHGVVDRRSVGGLKWITVVAE